MASENAVQLEQVTKRFNGRPAVDAVDLLVPTGSIFGFIGPNGSGKTTAMRMILRIYKPDAGNVVVLGNSTGKAADHRVGYLPEERGLYKRMTVRGVLRYFAKLKGISRPESIIDQQLARLGADDWAKKRIEQLSKGMAQKIQFIVATIASPELLILDEPFSGLDPINLELLRDRVLEFRTNGTTVIFSTHDMDVAQHLCDRVFMIYQGRKVLDGTIDEIRQDYGNYRLRVRMAPGADIPYQIPGVVQRDDNGEQIELILEDQAARHSVLQTLSAAGDVEHFETVRPTLRDIFVQIAKPEFDYPDSREAASEQTPDA